MIRINFFFLFLYLIFVLNIFPNSTLVNKVRNSINKIKPFKVEFVAQVSSEGEIEIEESGEIIFKDIHKLKWTYLNPDYKVFVLTGTDYKFYDKENEQLTIGNIKDNNEQWIWQLIFSEKYSKYIRCDEYKKKIYINNDSENINVVIFLNNDFLPEKVIQNDPSGVKLIHFFKGYKKKIKITKEEFELKLPENIDILNLQ